MKIKSVKRIISIVLAVAMCSCTFVFAADDIKAKAQTALKETMADMEKLLIANGSGYGNEWMVMDLALYGSKNESIFSDYYKSAEKFVAETVPSVNVEGA